MDVLSNLVITRVYSASTMYTEANTRIKRTGRPSWAVVLKYEGETVYYAGGKEYISNKSNPVILPRGCSYEWQCKSAGHFVIVEFECDATADTPLGLASKNDERLLRMFKDLEYKRTLKRPFAEMESIRDLYTILLTLLPTEPKKYLPTDRQKKIAPALDYIAKNYGTGIKNEELATLTGLSTVYFRKLFTEIMGQSPVTYIQEVRIRKAQEMLQSDYGSITDVAFSLGYRSIYDFSRAFKRQTGISPTQYKARRSLPHWE